MFLYKDIQNDWINWSYSIVLRIVNDLILIFKIETEAEFIEWVYGLTKSLILSIPLSKTNNLTLYHISKNSNLHYILQRYYIRYVSAQLQQPKNFEKPYWSGFAKFSPSDPHYALDFSIRVYPSLFLRPSIFFHTGKMRWYTGHCIAKSLTMSCVKV